MNKDQIIQEIHKYWSDKSRSASQTVEDLGEILEALQEDIDMLEDDIAAGRAE